MPFDGKRLVVGAAFAGCLVYVRWRGQDLEGGAAPRPDELSALGLSMREVGAERGVAFRSRSATFDAKLGPIMPHVSGLGASVSCCDADGDGRADFYATTCADGEPNALFVQRPESADGRFADVAEAAGVARLNAAGEAASMGSVWADVDGDGDEDGYLYAYGRQRLLRNQGVDGGPGTLRFDVEGREIGLPAWMNSNTAAWIDYDRDGFLDLYAAGYFRETIDLWRLDSTRIMQSSFEFASNGGHNVLLRNEGGERFRDVTAEVGGDSTRWTLAVAAADFDQNGWQDLYLANDYGPEELFLNVEAASNDEGGGGVRARRLELQSGLGLEADSKSGMSVAVGDVRLRGVADVYVTNISSPGFIFQGNNLRLNALAGGGGMQNVAAGVVANCGWGWGSQFGDLDLDGDPDLWVLNGFRSASRERDWWYGMQKIGGGLSEIFEDAAHWPPFDPERSLSGYERSRVLINDGRGNFFDAAGEIGVADLFDGRGVSFADLDGDPALEALVANQEGPLLLYDATVDPNRHWIGFDLVGAGANTRAVGASVLLRYGGRRQLQTVMAGSGFCSQNGHVLVFGLGGANAIEGAEVRWTSGNVTQLGALEIDRVQRVREPRPSEEEPR